IDCFLNGRLITGKFKTITLYKRTSSEIKPKVTDISPIDGRYGSSENGGVYATMKLFTLFRKTPSITRNEAVKRSDGVSRTFLERNILKGIITPTTSSIVNITLAVFISYR